MNYAQHVTFAPAPHHSDLAFMLNCSGHSLKPWNQQTQYVTAQGNHCIGNKKNLRQSKTLIIQMSSAHKILASIQKPTIFLCGLGKTILDHQVLMILPYNTSQVLLILNHLQSYSTITLSNVRGPPDFQQFSDRINLNFLHCNITQSFLQQCSYSASSYRPFTQVKANMWKEVK